MVNKIYPEVIYCGKNEHEVFKAYYPDGSKMALPLQPSLNLRDHSPTGFSWGYSGSGPAQLALALLYDATSDPKLATDYYQDFKWSVVSNFGDTWQMLRSEILEWLEQLRSVELIKIQAVN